MIYLTGVSNTETRNRADSDLYGRLGLMLSPTTAGGEQSKNDYVGHIPDYSGWAFDNGCFAGDFAGEAWLERLAEIIERVDGAWTSCRFAVAPDVFDRAAMIGDAAATIERSLEWLHRIRAVGAPAALVFQDGVDVIEDEIPWNEFDVAFLGGGDSFKLGYPARRPNQRAGSLEYDRESRRSARWAALIARCHAEGKEIHVGRVNTLGRLAFAESIGASSVDGTLLAHAGTTEGLRRLGRWLPQFSA